MTSILLLMVLASCKKDRVTYYSYNGVTVTRIDKERESYFYYGYCDGEKIKCPSSYIFSKYHRGTDIMMGYIVFKSTDTVVIVNSENIHQVGNNDYFKLFEFDNIKQILRWQDSTEGNYNNIALVTTYKANPIYLFNPI